MGSRKEEEKNEKAIRNILRRAPNRRCINCNSLGPQYVCLNFWTFVCTQCSGIHREFTHRVKSVSMSKFSAQDVANLENGGNERAREVYFKDWDPQRQSLPDSSNVDRLRDFIKRVYMEKRFSGESPLPRARGGEREGMHENRQPEARPNYHSDSRSPSSEDRYDDRQTGRRYSNFGYDDRRSDEPGGHYGEKRSPGRFEIDRTRYERNYNDNRRYDDKVRHEHRERYSDDRYNEGLDRRYEERFAKSNRDYGGNSPPPVRPVKEILGEDAPPLRVDDSDSSINGGREVDRSQRSQDGRGQRFGSSSSFGSVDSVPTSAPMPVVKKEDSGSLIDFMAEPEASVVREQPDPFGTVGVQPAASTSTSTGWAAFDTFSTARPAAPGPVPASLSTSGVSGVFDNPAQSNGSTAWVSQWPTMQSASVSSSVESSADSWSALVGPVSEPSISAESSQPWGPFSTSSAPIPANPLPPRHMVASQSVNSSEVAITQVAPSQSTSRRTIPEDFFMGSQTGLQLLGAPSPAPQYTFPGGTSMPDVGTYSQPQRSRNPFDLPGDSSSGSAIGEFLSMKPLQAALPTYNMGPMLMPESGSGTLGPQWAQTNMMIPQPASYPPAPSSGGLFIRQQMPNVMPQIMQAGSMGPSMGVGMPGGFPTAPKQGHEYHFPIQSPQLSTHNLFGIRPEHSYTAQGGHPQMPFQRPVGSSDAGFYGQVGHRLISQSSLGSLSSMPGTDFHFPAQAPAQLTRHSSLDPVGNPFG